MQKIIISNVYTSNTFFLFLFFLLPMEKKKKRKKEDNLKLGIEKTLENLDTVSWFETM